MTKEEIAFQTMAEYSARLGIPAKDVLASDSLLRDFYPEDREANHRYDGLASNYTYIKTKGRSVRWIKHTVAHELIHYAFHIAHGRNYERYIHALQTGNLFFTGQFRKTNEALFTGKLTKIDVLITDFKKPKLDPDKVLMVLDDKIKRFRSKIKMLNTRLKKLERKRKRLVKNNG